MKRARHILFTHSDEELFSSEIKTLFPATMFIDDMVWETKTPPAKSSITDCESKFVYIWNREIYPTLPYGPSIDGKFQGPQSGMVIQLIRSRFKDDVTLLSGEMSVGISVDRPGVEAMTVFVKGVWRILKRITPKKVVQVNPETREILFTRTDISAGNDAYDWCAARENRFLKFNNNIHIYLRPL